jgi:hypothetical protein
MNSSHVTDWHLNKGYNYLGQEEESTVYMMHAGRREYIKPGTMRQACLSLNFF